MDRTENQAGTRDAEGVKFSPEEMTRLKELANSPASPTGPDKSPLDPLVKGALQKAKKILVAVHGIGDQFQFETIQLVALRYSAYFDEPASIPLGSFHAQAVEECGFLVVGPPSFPKELATVGFAEIYWADIPRKIQTEGYRLEEAKNWARTLVGRVKLRQREVRDMMENEGKARGGKAKEWEQTLTPGDFDMLVEVLEGMIDGVQVIENLLYLAGQVGLPKFKLRKLLDSFLGDVQIVTEFEADRKQLLRRFHDVMKKIEEITNDDAEIYVVGHSEGTVVAFLGLLEALADPEKHKWAGKVRGFMTIGSPIDKHLILWPDLWKKHEKKDTANPDSIRGTSPAPEGAHTKIEWRNYYDHGDPIAFNLETAREWLEHNGWDKVFSFKEEDDIGFSRYSLPGQAHVKYWDDALVFGHFFKQVVKPEVPDKYREKSDKFDKPPGNRIGVRFVSLVLPYLMSLSLLFGGVYLLFKAVRNFAAPPESRAYFQQVKNHRDSRDPRPLASLSREEREKLPQSDTIPTEDSIPYVASNVFGIALLMAGITLFVRVPRLTKSRWVRGIAAVPLLLAFVIYPLAVAPSIRGWLGVPVAWAFKWVEVPDVAAKPVKDLLPFEILGDLRVADRDDLVVQLKDPKVKVGNFLDPPTVGVVLTTLLLVGIASWLSGTYPNAGVKILLLLSGVVIILIVGGSVFNDYQHNPKDRQPLGPLWPLFPALAFFLYLWWLAIIFFDLTFVWHRYIRNFVALKRLRDVYHGKTNSR